MHTPPISLFCSWKLQWGGRVSTDCAYALTQVSAAVWRVSGILIATLCVPVRDRASPFSNADLFDFLDKQSTPLGVGDRTRNIVLTNDRNASLSYAAAFGRLDRTVVALAHASRIDVSVDIDVEAPRFAAGLVRYRISLDSGNNRATVHIDHDALTDNEELFTAFTVPQLHAAIERLKYSVKQLVDSRPAGTLDPVY